MKYRPGSQGWRIRADVCAGLSGLTCVCRDVKLIIIITIFVIIIRWWGVRFRVRGRVKRWVQMSCMPLRYEEPCSDQEVRPSLLPWMLVKNLQVLLNLFTSLLYDFNSYEILFNSTSALWPRTIWYNYCSRDNCYSWYPLSHDEVLKRCHLVSQGAIKQKNIAFFRFRL